MSRGGYRPGSGRKPGSKVHNQEVVTAFYNGIVNHPEYQARLQQRALSGELAPQIEVMIHHYALGKPIEQRNPDDTAFINDLMTVVWRHVPSAEGRQAIREVIQAHLGGTQLYMAAS